MDEQELERILQTATREVQTLGKVSDETAKQLAQAGNAMQRFKQASVQGSKDVLKGAKGFTRALSSGEASFESLVPVVEGLGDAVSGLVKGVIPYAGDGIGKFGSALTDMAVFLVRRLGQTVGTFQDVSKTGGIAAGGLETLAKQAADSNMSLSGFGRLVTTNASALAKLEGSVFDGAQAMTGILAPLNQGEFSNTLRSLGLTVDEIGEFAGDFVGRQARLGIAQRMDQNQLSRAAAQYVTELDQLSKLTGVNRKALADEQQAILNETRFRARYEEISQMYGEDAARRVMEFVQTVGAQSPRFAEGIKDIFATGGAAITPAGQQLMLAAGDQIQMILDQVLQSQDSAAVTSARAADQLRTAIGPFVREITPLAGMIQDGGSIMTEGFAGILDFFNNVKQTAETGQNIVDAQGKQIISTNDMTQSAINAQKALERYARTIDILTIQALDPTAKVTEKIAKVMKDLGLDFEAMTKNNDYSFGRTTKNFKEASKVAIVKTGEIIADRLTVKTATGGSTLANMPGMIDLVQSLITGKTVGQMIQGNYLGGTVGANEISLVGERGPEIIAGPASVISTSTSERILQNMTGPKSSYTPMSSSMASMTTEMATPAPVTALGRTDMAHTDLLKAQVGKLDQMIEILTKGNRIGQQQVRATYS
jgi:hypothetical protein